MVVLVMVVPKNPPSSAARYRPPPRPLPSPLAVLKAMVLASRQHGAVAKMPPPALR